MTTYLFYLATGPAPAEVVDSQTLPDGYRWVLWKPTLRSLVPPGLKWWLCARRTLWHYLHIFACRDYSILLIYHGDAFVHHSFVVPQWFRYPFMSGNDLQIINTWTVPQHRGHGLATFALSRILAAYAAPKRRLWYVVADNNVGSIRVVEKCGFVLIGKGSRVHSVWNRLLDRFQIREWTAGFAAFYDWLN